MVMIFLLENYHNYFIFIHLQYGPGFISMSQEIHGLSGGGGV